MSRSAKTWEWFRLHSADWDAQAVATLDLATQGFLLLLVRRMIEQMSPVSMDAIRMMSRQYGLQKKSVDRLVELLKDRGVIFETEQGFWCDIAEREFALREEKTENFSKRNAKLSKKRWQKTKENQAISIPDKERDIEGQPPSGTAPSPHRNHVFSLDDLHRLPPDVIIPPDAAKAARAEIIEFFVADIIVDANKAERVKDRVRSKIGNMFDRGSLTKRRAEKVVDACNLRSDAEGGFDELSA